MRKNISTRLNAVNWVGMLGVGCCVGEDEGNGRVSKELTRNEHVLVRGADELHGTLREESHVLVHRVAGDIFVGAVVERDKDVQQD